MKLREMKFIPMLQIFKNIFSSSYKRTKHVFRLSSIYKGKPTLRQLINARVFINANLALILNSTKCKDFDPSTLNNFVKHKIFGVSFALINSIINLYP